VEGLDNATCEEEEKARKVIGRGGLDRQLPSFKEVGIRRYVCFAFVGCLLWSSLGRSSALSL